MSKPTKKELHDLSKYIEKLEKKIKDQTAVIFEIQKEAYLLRAKHNAIRRLLTTLIKELDVLK